MSLEKLVYTDEPFDPLWMGGDQIEWGKMPPSARPVPVEEVLDYFCAYTPIRVGYIQVYAYATEDSKYFKKGAWKGFQGAYRILMFADRGYAFNRDEAYRFGCDHRYEQTRLSMHVHRYTCKVCGYSQTVDSSG